MVGVGVYRRNFRFPHPGPNIPAGEGGLVHGVRERQLPLCSFWLEFGSYEGVSCAAALQGSSAPKARGGTAKGNLGLLDSGSSPE